MNKTNEGRRIILAVTERSPLQAVWRVAEEYLDESQDELITFMVHDERWRRAASLPFTHEVSRFSGRRQDFTQWRAAQIDAAAATRLARQLRRLAQGARLKVSFEVLPEREVTDRLNQVSVTKDVLIASSELKRRPVYPELVRLQCQILFVEADE